MAAVHHRPATGRRSTTRPPAPPPARDILVHKHIVAHGNETIGTEVGVDVLEKRRFQPSGVRGVVRIPLAVLVTSVLVATLAACTHPPRPAEPGASVGTSLDQTVAYPASAADRLHRRPHLARPLCREDRGHQRRDDPVPGDLPTGHREPGRHRTGGRRRRPGQPHRVPEHHDRSRPRHPRPTPSVRLWTGPSPVCR